MSDHDREVRTRTLARIIGPYLLIAAVALIMRRAELPAFLAAFMENEQLVFVTGAFTVMVGLTVLAAHHYWGSVSATLISLLGVIATLKGAALMIAPEFGAETTEMLVRTPSILVFAIGADLLLALWLCFAGWRSRPSPALPI